MQERVVNEMARILSEKEQELKIDPKKVVEEARKEALSKFPAYFGDVWTYRVVVTALGFAVLIAAVGGIILTYFNKTPPEMLIALGSAAIGALAGLLTPFKSGEEG